MKAHWFGKMAGLLIGLVIGKSWVFAAAGFFIGHQLDIYLQKPKRQNASSELIRELFFQATFLVMGYVAKIDGVVSHQEIAQTEAMMKELQFDREQRARAISYFQKGKNAEFNLEHVLQTLRDYCIHHQVLLEMFIDMQLLIALADGMTLNKQRLLRYLCDQLAPDPRLRFYFHQKYSTYYETTAGFQKQSYTHRQTHQRQEQQQKRPEQRIRYDFDPYQILGISESATPPQIKTAYRKLIRQHHPDKLIAQGLPKEMIRIATEKTQALHAAYQAIKKQRGFT